MVRNEQDTLVLFAAPQIHGVNPELGLDYFKKQSEAEQQRLEKILNKYMHRAREAGKSNVMISVGQPGDHRESICNAALHVKADAIILGSRGLSTTQSLLVGSVCDYVVHHAPCSVFVVRPH
eukprot:TRINITY_DN1302_c0_g1_i2.p1 TRINITY_DN1302_c0_g1~~TRINITY_DN1302_c0_g1_i2.p1  ORF type:complete len:122 (+),score=36.18 TRINITY_DN1302_c0_g1_i2:105-470(+)